MKIGILTFQWSNNYGAALQTFALKTFLSNKCEVGDAFDVNVINYKRSYPKPSNTISSRIKDFILYFLLIPDKRKIKQRNSRFDEFRTDFFNLTKQYNSIDELEGLDFDSIFFGSDQIWNPKLTGGNLDPAYFGYFDTGAKRIAYAASIGEKCVRLEDVDLITEYLRGFDSISVRESQMLTEIGKYTDKTIYNTLDPTLLLSEQDYRDIASERIIDEKYILIYQNTRNDNTYKIARQIAEKTGLKIYEVGYRRQVPSTGIPSVENAGPREFLALYRDAEYVVSNTFHGTVFSIMFKKQFISIPLKGREHRVISLAQKLGLDERLVAAYDSELINQLMNTSNDYDVVSLKLENERKKSIEYIKEAIGGEMK